MSRIASTTSLLSPDTVRDIQSLQMFARHIVDGLSIGRHASHHKGFSTEFKEHRSYVPGDQLRSLDWKLYAKTDRLYIKQFEEEINLQCMIAIDSSASMNYAGTRANELTKYQYASSLAACIAYLLLRQQDAVGLSRLSGSALDYVPPRSRPNYLQDITTKLVSPPEVVDTPLTESLSNLARRLKGRYLLFIISDLMDDVDHLLKIIKLLRGARHDVVLFQIWDRDELEFPFSSMVEFRDLELSATTQIVNCAQIAAAYRDNAQAFQTRMQSGCREHGIDYVPCLTDMTCSDVLQRFLLDRSRGR